MDPQVPAEVEEQVAKSTNDFLSNVSKMRIILVCLQI